MKFKICQTKCFIKYFEKQCVVKNSSKTMPERPGTPPERCALKDDGAYSFRNYRFTTFMIPAYDIYDLPPAVRNNGKTNHFCEA